MSSNADNNSNNNLRHASRPAGIFIIGIIMVAVGALVLADQYLKTGWLPLALIPVVGIYLLVEAYRTHKFSLLLSGGVLIGAGMGAFAGFSNFFQRPLVHDIGWLLVVFALGWVLVSVLSKRVLDEPVWWPLVPGGIILSVGLVFLLTELRFLDFVLWIGTGIGIILLIWGISWGKFGLIIPGSLMITIAPGIFLAWGRTYELNPLAKTGIMIAVFSIGWFLIILFSRVTTAKFVWWPLIPGGILAMVGWGLYIGGDPGNAPTFIANTGSIGLIIFGIYLLLMRKGIHH